VLPYSPAAFAVQKVSTSEVARTTKPVQQFIDPIELLRPIAFHPALVDICDGYIPAGLMLSQILYWTPRTGPEAEGWFYKTQEQWYLELRLTRTQQEAARKILRLKGFIDESVRKHGGGTKIHFRANQLLIGASLSTCRKPASPLAGNLHTPLQETCKSYKEAETTTETTTLEPSAAARQEGFSLVGDQANPKKVSDPRHASCKDLIFRCYGFLNHGTLPPWDASDAKQLSTLLRAMPTLTADEFHAWLGHYAASENINPASRPRNLLTKIAEYASGPLNKYGRPLNANEDLTASERRVTATRTSISNSLRKIVSKRNGHDGSEQQVCPTGRTDGRAIPALLAKNAGGD
jgi:hypothetical protein